jgi:H+-translocating NAD(P) transhydrogenase subunit alpha
MVIGVPKETFPGERRVALVPADLPALSRAGHGAVIERGAGEAACFPDAAYERAGARIAPERDEVFAAADLILQVRVCGANLLAGDADRSLLRAGQTVIGLCHPFTSATTARELAERGVTLFSMELMPRITRAQCMDALSSQSTVTGYKAALLAADTLPRLFPMLITAAGTIAAARVFVIGAGVIGLQAMATARRLGAVVQAYDVRAAAHDQVESVGAKFVDLGLEPAEAEGRGGYARALGDEFYGRQQEKLARVVGESDVVIATAFVPGAPAPRLVTRAAIAQMAPGSVVVDVAAPRGGNCELTRPGETIVHAGVTIHGPLNLPSTVPYHASQLYSKNVVTFLLYAMRPGAPGLDRRDEIVAETLVTCGGQVVHPRVREILGLGPLEG